MALPFETPGGYQDDDTTPDSGRPDDLTAGYDGYRHDTGTDTGDYGDDDLDFDFDTDGFGQAGPSGWDDTGPAGRLGQM